MDGINLAGIWRGYNNETRIGSDKFKKYEYISNTGGSDGKTRT